MSAEMRAQVHGVVRSEVRACSAGAPARVQRVVRRVVGKPVRGEAGTRRRTGCTGASRGDARSRAQPARASEASTATSEARSAGARRTRRSPARRRRTVPRACRSGSGGERSEPPGKRSAQRPKGAEARGIPARRAETAQRARQGSPVAKRRAQTHRPAHRPVIHHRHRRRHRPPHYRQHCHHRRQRHGRRHDDSHQHRRGHRLAASIVAGRADTESTIADAEQGNGERTAAGMMVNGKSGGAAAERGAVGAGRREGVPRGGGASLRPKKGVRAAPANRRDPRGVALRRRSGRRGCRA